jgi:membrane-associated phospholipid phosphatase
MEYLARYAQFVLQIFSARFLLLHIVAIASTALLVLTGFDWTYLVYVLNAVPPQVLFIADVTGFVLPVLLIVVSIGVLIVSRKQIQRLYAEAMVYAILLGFSLSTIIKAFAGRTSPPHRHRGEELVLIDNSNGFDFGFMNHHVIGGWPSSHATIAFAIATTLVLLLPKRWYVHAALFIPALFVSVGVTFGFHWLSEFVAGALLGIAIGIAVGSYYKTKV